MRPSARLAKIDPPPSETALFTIGMHAAAPEPDPVSWAEALSGPHAEEWLSAGKVRFDALTANGVWTLVDRTSVPSGRRILQTKPVFKTKFHADGEFDKRSIRIAVKGYQQRAGVDYHDIFSPVASYETTRITLSIAAAEDCDVIDAIDYQAAFTQADIVDEVYIEQPERLADGTDRVFRLVKSLEGCHQSGRRWYQLLASTLESMGFVRVKSLPSCHLLTKDDVKVVIPVYVDDKLLICNSRVFADKLIIEFKRRHKLRHLGPATSFLGMHLTRDRKNRTIELSQPAYVTKVLAKFGFANAARPAKTPLPEGAVYSKAQSPQTDAERAAMRSIPYLEAVGVILFLANTTRPDLSYAAAVLSRYCSGPGPAHWTGVKHVFRYLQGTQDYRLRIGGTSTDLSAYSDAAYGDCKDDGKSTSGHVVFMDRGAVTWSCRKQPVVAQATMESELVGANLAGRDVVHIRTAMDELGRPQLSPTTLFVDNQAAIKVASEQDYMGRAKHMQLRWFWLRDQIEAGDIRIEYIPTAEQVADIFTKPLGAEKHRRFCRMLGLYGKALDIAK